MSERLAVRGEIVCACGRIRFIIERCNCGVTDGMIAQAGEAGTAATTKIGAVHEHAVPEGDAPVTGRAI